MKYFIKPQKYIYLESTCPDLYNDEIYQILGLLRHVVSDKIFEIIVSKNVRHFDIS